MKRKTATQSRTNSPLFWHAIVALALYGLFGLSVSGFGDTYNFYFGKKGKPGMSEQAGDSQQEEEIADEAAEKPAPPVAPVAQPQQQPIIINNYNNNDNSNRNNLNAPGTSEALPSVPAEPTARNEEPQNDDWIRTPNPMYQRKQWSFALGGMTSYYAVGPYASVTYSPTSLLEFTAFGAMEYLSLYSGVALGAEVGVVPVRISFAENWDLIRLGVLLGAGASGEVYGGLRATLNLGSSFGLSASLRTNGYYGALEGSLVFPL